MILVLGGTADGRKIAASLQKEGYPVLVSTATEYGASLVEGSPVRCGVLDQRGFAELFHQENIKLVVDASHPYAVLVSQNAMAGCAATGIPYLRYERQAASLPDYPLIYRVESFVAAAEASGKLGDCIFLGTGSNNLACFTNAPGLQGKRLVARVLPSPEIIKKCLHEGIKLENLIAMQGPFSTELNLAMYRHYGVQVVVSKESGDEGGTDAKVLAAIEQGIPIVLVDRPHLAYPAVVQDWPSILRYLATISAV